MTGQNSIGERASTTNCVHHWVVEPAGGPTSGARCRRCGDERLFYNDPDAVLLHDDKPRGMHQFSNQEARKTA